jgi:hypothetical protein
VGETDAMQLLLQRSQRGDGTLFWPPPLFKLWAKFELTAEEHALINKYHVRNFTLWEGNRRRDFLRALLFGFLPGLIAAAVFVRMFNLAGSGWGALWAIIVFAAVIYGIYQSIREEIRVADILDGRFFKCRSVVTLLAKEQHLREMAQVFRSFLEAMKTWGGQEVIEIEPDRLPAVRLIEPARAAA